jgi:predicted NBD/HSP70 family sugar kinase
MTRGTVATLAGATQDEVRRHNLGNLLRLLHVRGSTSRSDLTALTGLNRSTVGGLASELAEAGLIRETTPAGRGVGRPSIVAEPDPDHAYVIAVDIGVERIVVARVGLGGHVLDRRGVRQQRGGYGATRMIRQVGRLVRVVLAGAADGAVCVGVGVGVCGVVRHADGLVRFAPNLGWVDAPLGELVAGLLPRGLPILVANDADLGARAEHTRGAAQGARSLVYLSGEVGVGGGILLDGAPLTGAGGYAGEVGHMVVNPQGRACRCGSTGCWETEIGEEALLIGAGLVEFDPAARIADVLAAVEAGDARATKAVREAGRWLGVGIANLVNLLNPEVVVLGGLLRELYPAAEPQVRASMAQALQAPREQVRLALPLLGGDSILLGAAELAFGPLLDDPLGGLARGAALVPA